MPREHVYANPVAVPAGDLPYLAARRAADLAAASRPPADPEAGGDRDRDRDRDGGDAPTRRLLVLEEFVAGLRSVLVDDPRAATGAPVDAAGERGLRRELESRLRTVTDALDRPRPARSRDRAERDAIAAEVAAEPTPAAAARFLQLRVTLAWSRGAGGPVTLGVTAHDRDADRGAEVDVGGFHVDLDWAALNRLVRLGRLARDESWPPA